ncbi:MAG: alpha/beta hydrolase family protein [Gemmataceae bacterium]
MHPRFFPCLALLGLVAASGDAQTKRPLTHGDYAAWRSIQSPVLSADGRYVALTVAPQEGDGDFVLIDVPAGKGVRHPRGSRPAVTETAAEKGKKKLAPPHAFTADGKYVLFSVYPTKAERDKKKSLAASAALAILEVAPNKLTRVENVRSFQVPEEASAFVAYLRSRPLPADPTKTPETETPKGRRGAPVVGPVALPPVSGELVLRNLADGTERTFSDVGEYSLSRDGKTLVYAVAGSKKDGTPGVFAVTPGQTLPPVVVRSGPGKYGKLTWDEKQTQLALFHTPPADGDKKLPPKVIHWKRTGGTAVPMAVGLTAVGAALPTGAELVADKPAVQPGWQISDAGGLSWSRDGKRLYFGMVPPAAAKAGADRPALELWHYRDDYIQPMQKARYAQTVAKTYRTVFTLADGTCRQLGDETLQDVTEAPEGDLALGTDDRAYRRLVGGAEQSQLGDTFLVNQKTGERKTLFKRQNGALWSPGGKYLMRWDGEAWHCTDVATGKSADLTGKLGVTFASETHDTPGTPPPYGLGGWTDGDESVLIYDRYDIWRVKPDGSDATNVTAGVGRKGGIALRVEKLDPKARTIDPAKTVLLKADNEATRDTGFYALSFKSGPKLLIMGARSYDVVASKSGRHLLRVQTFYDCPDLYSADADFREVRRLTDVNPQKKDFVWGRAELVKYKSADGVPLEGVLLKPEDFDPKKKYPMMVYIYERLSQNLHRFVDPRPGTSINPSYYASNGYLVLMPDIAYAVGYPGQSAQKCILPAVEKVVDLGCVDEKAIGIQGHSWGGYQTAYLITQTTRFKAASAGAPVTNMTSAYGGIRWESGLPRQFQYEKAQSRIGGTLWEHPSRFVENSPLFMADRVKTPLIMLHNDKDGAVPWQEGIQYYLALRRLDKEAYLFNYVGEGHGLTQRKNQHDYTVRMQQFFDHHLKGAAKPAWMVKGEAYTPPAIPGRPAAPPAAEREE